ncbi:MAG: colicin transporter [Sphingomonadales bacterium]|nr:colicin transporter [Sphingomonadales bacterium]
MIAIKRLQSIMWILVVAMGALCAYLISLRVATERNAVHDMIDQIRWTRAEIRYLEAEFGARASMRQLNAWNQNDLRLYVPGPAQYLADERELANLDRMAPTGGGYAPPPVMTVELAQAEEAPRPVPAVVPAVKAKPVVEAPARAAPSEFSLIKTAQAAEPRVKSNAQVRLLVDTAMKPAGKPDPDARKKARLALLDEKLLGGGSLATLERAAKAEAKAKAR